MNRQEAIRQLIDLHYKFRNYCEVETTEADVQVLEYAINELERTAQEVPVQEQPKTLEFINKEFDINLSQKQYDDIAILDLCTQKYTAYEILKLLKMLEII